MCVNVTISSFPFQVDTFVRDRFTTTSTDTRSHTSVSLYPLRRHPPPVPVRPRTGIPSETSPRDDQSVSDGQVFDTTSGVPPYGGPVASDDTFVRTGPTQGPLRSSDCVRVEPDPERVPVLMGSLKSRVSRRCRFQKISSFNSDPSTRRDRHKVMSKRV